MLPKNFPNNGDAISFELSAIYLASPVYPHGKFSITAITSTSGKFYKILVEADSDLGHIEVFGCDCQYLYIGGIGNYALVSIDKVLVPSNMKWTDMTAITMDIVDTVPTGYVTATVRTRLDTGNVESYVKPYADAVGDALASHTHTATEIGACRVETGTYIGNGVTNSRFEFNGEFTSSITFPSQPKMVIISSLGPGGTTYYNRSCFSLWYIGTPDRIYNLNDYSSVDTERLYHECALSGNTLSFLGLNTHGYTYAYTAIL